MKLIAVAVGAIAALAGGFIAYKARHHHKQAAEASPEHTDEHASSKHVGPHVGPRKPGHVGPHVAHDPHIVPGAEVDVKGVFNPFTAASPFS